MSNLRESLEATAINCQPNLSFAKDIATLFTPLDVEHMKTVAHLDLSNYNSVKVWAHKIYSEVSSGDMPPAGSGEDQWTPDMVNTFACWIMQGCQP